MDFKKFRDLMQEHIADMVEGENHLFAVGVEKSELWDLYLDSFPAGANEIFRKRREMDCSCCKQFIRQFGNVVAIVDNKPVTIWDFQTGGAKFQPVIDALAAHIKALPVTDVFITKQAGFGTDLSHEMLKDKTVRTWNHFRFVLPGRFTTDSHKSESALMAQFRDSRSAFKRSLEEISRGAIETALDLIAENTLYRGEEWKAVLTKLLTLRSEYHAVPDGEKENWLWATSVKVGGAVSRVRNHSIGVLLQDISSGVDVVEAVRKYEVIVAPQNYKRPRPIFTKNMVEDAEKTVTRLGLQDSLGRRHARLDDISPNNVIWANKDAEREMLGAGIFEALKREATENPKRFDSVPGIDVKDFIRDLLPGTVNLSALVENRHQPSLMSLIAPMVTDAPTLFKWGNGFTWAYNGNLADSMKERVKAAGGNVEGILRFSIQWNDGEYNPNDFDAHCIEPSGGNHIYFANMGPHRSTGVLDVDIISPVRNKAAVENITWSLLGSMLEGEYKFFVKNFSHNGGRTGFDAEIEYNGQIYEYAYHKELRHKEDVLVARIRFNQRDGVKFLESLPSTTSSKTVWGLTTNQFHPVSTVTFSPNYWDEQGGIGNRHYFFMLAGCRRDDRPNGFFNEYLKEDFMEHKQVFAALGSKMKVEQTAAQLSGLGFSSTKRNSLIAKADEQIIKIVF